MIVERLIEQIEWDQLRSASGPSSFVPGAVRELLGSSSYDEAEAAYWKLDNDVVVQGQLFESARWIIAPLLVVLSQPRPSFVREQVANLLVEIAFGEPHEREFEAGGEPGLGQHCVDELRGGLSAFYAMLDDPVPVLRLGGLDLLDVAEQNRHRLSALATSMIKDEDSKVARRAIELSR